MNGTLRISLLLTTLLTGALNAAVYYVSPSGNDAANGLSPGTAWQTIARVQELSNYGLPGDQILFERGGTYRGQLQWSSSGTSASNIVFGAYGTGDRPLISGNKQVSGWTQHAGNVYRANVSGSVQHVFVNGALQTLARFPNTGWLRIANSTNTQISSPGITQSSGQWNGGTMVLRSTNWCYENRVISAHVGNTIDFPSTTYFAGNYDWGFFLCNKLSELDSPGEWYHDPATGVLYLWAPNGGNPSSLNVEASSYDYGIWAEWQRSYITVQDIAFTGQKIAGVALSGSNHVTVTQCSFEKLNQGIQSYSSFNSYSDCTFRETYASAVQLIDNNTTIEDCTFNDIALVAGLGESTTGYFGIRMIGQNNVIRNNRLDRIGYSGIFFEGSPLVERNVISGCMATVNDGGGIYFDNANNAVVQDNIVRDPIGNMESVATNFTVNYRILHGVYFGNAVITGTVVQRNTVSNGTSGVHVDHTMVSNNNQVKDNVLFNNKFQLSISDYSNFNAPGATAPFYVPAFNTVYSGNELYSLAPEQLCMYILNCYGPGNVDFGTFTNNKVFSPYNELSIYSENQAQASFRIYTLEHWQSVRNDEVGSTRSPLRSAKYRTVSELSGNLVANGDFNAAVDGWAGWPANAQITRDDTYLDNGALKAYLPNNSQSTVFYMNNPDEFPMQSGQWYRMRMSVQSNIHGTVVAGVKGVSQLGSPNYIHSENIPFDTERRDMEVFFQGNLSDQAVVAFSNNYLDPMYWLDNVELHRVTVVPRIPAEEHLLLINEQTSAQSFSLPAGCWSDMNGNMLSGPVTVQPYRSKIIYQVPGNDCNSPAASTVGGKVFLGGAFEPSTGVMRADLSAQGMLPSTEPYTADGHVLENAGVTVSNALLSATGSQAIVDWVLVELRNNNTGNTIAAARAALVRANGELVSPTGSSQMEFNVPTVGKRFVVRHRNHLAAMVETPIATNGQVVDMTLTSTALHGTNAAWNAGGHQVLWPGDVNADGQVQYTGAGNDRDPLLVFLGTLEATNIITGYARTDVNLDGRTMYTGAGNDRDPILVVIGGAEATVIVGSQVDQ